VAKPTNEQFNEMVADHIEKGNEQSRQTEAGVAGAAMTQAAARFNAYVSSLQYVSGRIMKEKRDIEIEHYLKLYRQMLENHYDEYASNYDQYRTPPRIG